MAGIDTQGYAVLLAQMGQDGLLISGGRVFPQRPDTAEGVPADEVVGFKFDDGGRDHIQKRLDTHILRSRSGGRSRSFQMDTSLVSGIKKAPECIRRQTVMILFLMFLPSVRLQGLSWFPPV